MQDEHYLTSYDDIASHIAACIKGVEDNRIARQWIVALSGGPDSTALLLFLKQEAPKCGAHLSAVIVNHNLRPESSDEAALVARRCHQWGIEAQVLPVTQTPPRHGQQEWARHQRYDLLCAYARAKGGVLWLGHHLYDQQETIAMRLAKGSHLYGLMAMRRVSYQQSVPLLRPLLSVPKERLIAYCDDNNASVVQDPTNRKAIYERTKWRGILAQDQKLSESLSRLGALAARAEASLSVYLRQFFDHYVTIEDHGLSCHIDAAAFYALSKQTQIMLLRRVITAFGQASYAPSFTSIKAACEKLRYGKTTTLSYCLLKAAAGRILCQPEAGRPHDAIFMKAGNNCAYRGQFIIHANEDVTLLPMTKARFQALAPDHAYRVLLMSYPDAIRMTFPYLVGLDEQPITPHIMKTIQMGHCASLDDATGQVAIVPIARLARIFVSDADTYLSHHEQIGHFNYEKG